MVPGSTSLLGKRTFSEMLFPEQSVLKRSSPSQLPVSLNHSIISSEFLMPSNDEGVSTHIHSSSNKILLDLATLTPISHLPQGWFEGTVGINTGDLWGSVDYPMLCRGPSTREFYGAGAGHWLLTPLKKPVQEFGESDDDMKKKWDVYAGKVVRSRENITSFFEHLLAGLVPPTFEIPVQPSPAPGSFEAFVAAASSSSDASCVASAHQIDIGGYGKTPQNEISMGPRKRVQELASKSKKNIEKLNPGAPKVLSTAIGMVAGASRNMNASLLLAKKRRENPLAVFTAAAVGMTGVAGQSMDASIRRRQILIQNPHAIVSASAVGMPGAAGQNIDGSYKLQAIRSRDPHAIVSAKEVGITGAAGQYIDEAIRRRNDYCEELDNLGTVFDIIQDGKQRRENVAPNETLKILESQYFRNVEGRLNSFEALQKAVDDPKRWHRSPDGRIIAHTLAAVALNDSSSLRNAFKAMDSRGLPAAPLPSGGRPQGKCPLCGKKMRLDSIEGHKKSRICVQRQQKNFRE
jgi:hypothetical protein